MNPENNSQGRAMKLVLGAVLLIGAVGFLGWTLGRKDTSSQNPPSSVSDQRPAPAAGDLSATASYRMPDGWREADCPNAPDISYVIPAGGDSLDCSKDPSSPIRISLDSGNTKDCNELQGANQVRKHVCISQFINGNKSLKASTEYLASSSYGRELTIDAYYIDTGKGVVKLEHIYPGNDGFTSGFDSLANSVVSL